MLYPIKFKPIIKDKIWGGSRLSNFLDKDINGTQTAGESWELSALPGNLSIVANGSLQGMNIVKLIDHYKSDLMGEVVYKKFGNQFPLLFKFIDANQFLSVQVHPDDEMAKSLHNSNGKTEMWYVVDCNADAELVVGFNTHLNRSKFIEHSKNGSVKSILNTVKVYKGDVFQIPAGRIHATGPGILFAEIQQSSDITYRVYDWDRKDEYGKERELHLELAAKAIDYDLKDAYKSKYEKKINTRVELEKCEYYTTNLIEFTKTINLDYSKIDSFKVFMVLEGSFSIKYNGSNEDCTVNKGDTVLIANALKSVELKPLANDNRMLEVYIDIQ